MIVNDFSKASTTLAFSGKSMMSECVPPAVQANLFSETRRGEVSVAAATLNASITEILFEVTPIDSSKTAVKAYYRKASSTSIDRAMRKWLAGTGTACHEN
jgi:hypothetical protein